jgi:hypothetical protein
MKFSRRPVVRFVAAFALLSPLVSPSGSTLTPAAPSPAKGLSPLSAVRPEVRLRKLHLVRPDLIPYPIASEIYC